MTALDHRPSAIGAGTRTLAVMARVADGVRSCFRAIANRREVSRLCDLTDSQLADIGLRRGDLVVVLRTPIDVDPTARLDAIARERLAIEAAARRTC